MKQAFAIRPRPRVLGLKHRRPVAPLGFGFGSGLQSKIVGASGGSQFCPTSADLARKQANVVRQLQ